MSLKIYNEIVSKFNEKTQKWETIYEDSYEHDGPVALAQEDPTLMGEDPREVYKDVLDMSAIITKNAKELVGQQQIQKNNLAQLASDSVKQAKAGKITLEQLQSRTSIIGQLAKDELDLQQIADQKKDIEDEITAIGRRYWGVNKAIGDEKIRQKMIDLETLANEEARLKAEEESAAILSEVDNLTGGIVGNVKEMYTNFKEASGTVKGLLAVGALIGIMKMVGETTDQIGDRFGAIGVTDFQHDIRAANVEAIGLGYSFEETAGTIEGLSHNFGIGFKEATGMAGASMETAKALGISTDTSAQLVGQLITMGGHTAESASESLKFTAALAKSAGVAPGVVMADMAESSEAIAAYTVGTGENMQRAAVQARQMGLSLADTAGIMDGLLDFQTSIAKEMEASVIIGKQLNFQKARELALNNDVEGAMNNILEQLGSEEEFNKLNAIQRRALADSIGVSVDKMANMVKFTGKTKEQLASMRDLSIEELVGKEAMSNIQELENTLRKWGATILNVLAWFAELGNGLGLLIPVLVVMGIWLAFSALQGWAFGAGISAAGTGAAAAAPGFTAFAAAGTAATPVLLSVALIIGVLALAIFAIGVALKFLPPVINSIASGFVMISEAIVGGLLQLAKPEVILGIGGLAGAFFLLAGALVAVASAGLIAIPALGVVLGFTAAMAALGMAGSSPSEERMTRIEQKISVLVAGFESGKYQTQIGKAVDGVKVKTDSAKGGAIY